MNSRVGIVFWFCLPLRQVLTGRPEPPFPQLQATVDDVFAALRSGNLDALRRLLSDPAGSEVLTVAQDEACGPCDLCAIRSRVRDDADTLRCLSAAYPRQTDAVSSTATRELAVSTRLSATHDRMVTLCYTPPARLGSSGLLPSSSTAAPRWTPATTCAWRRRPLHTRSFRLMHRLLFLPALLLTPHKSMWRRSARPRSTRRAAATTPTALSRCWREGRRRTPSATCAQNPPPSFKQWCLQSPSSRLPAPRLPQNKWSALHIAANFGHAATCRVLLDRGAKTHLRNKARWQLSPLASPHHRSPRRPGKKGD